ncbi:hypothetical protein LGN07_06710 [Burkholderia cepacia]|uniref:hypothetical protein n=1 Tax=Burkholderia cepacia TaxID=292 RepID=UPI001CF56508|nr:hypothetical protein [Burkholderia cepacia]MCA8118400.1 hypothetical protein [Burkholderia cepacia]
MPHLTLEYSANLDGFDAGATLRALNAALAASGHFDERDIKSPRAARCGSIHLRSARRRRRARSSTRSSRC